MAKSDLGYVNGLIASMYKTLIPRDKLMRLAEAEPEEIFRALKEQGYAGDARSSRDYQILLENETEKLLRFISDGDFGDRSLNFDRRDVGEFASCREQKGNDAGTCAELACLLFGLPPDAPCANAIWATSATCLFRAANFRSNNLKWPYSEERRILPTA